MSDKYRPEPEHRWTTNVRDEPGQIKVRTRFLYSEFDERVLVPPGETRHAFSRGGSVTGSDWPATYSHGETVADHVHRAIASFGDDRDLIIEVRPA